MGKEFRLSHSADYLLEACGQRLAPLLRSDCDDLQALLVRVCNHLSSDVRSILSSNFPIDIKDELIALGRIGLETPDSIVRLIHSGHLSQVSVLMRWYIESYGVLMYLTFSGHEKRLKWLEGKLKIKPNHAWKLYKDKLELPSFEKTYSDLSEVAHLTSLYLKKDNAWYFATKPTVIQQRVFVSLMMWDLCVFATKFATTFCSIRAKIENRTTENEDAEFGEWFNILKTVKERQEKLFGSVASTSKLHPNQ